MALTSQTYCALQLVAKVLGVLEVLENSNSTIQKLLSGWKTMTPFVASK